MRPYLLSLRQRTLPTREGAQPILQLYRLHGHHVHVIHHFSYSLACVNMSKISCANQAQSGEYRGRTDDPLLAKQVL